MRFNHHSPSHWLAVALVGAIALFTFGHARGQGATAAAAFEGRPALAGAQGGLGAQAGVPQGGVGVQGNEASQRQLNLRKPSGLDDVPAVPVAAAGTTPAVDAAAAPVSRRSEVTLVPKGDDVARQERSPTRTVKKSARRTVERSRTGVGGIDAAGGTPK